VLKRRKGQESASSTGRRAFAKTRLKLALMCSAFSAPRGPLKKLVQRIQNQCVFVTIEQTVTGLSAWKTFAVVQITIPPPACWHSIVVVCCCCCLLLLLFVVCCLLFVVCCCLLLSSLLLFVVVVVCCCCCLLLLLALTTFAVNCINASPRACAAAPRLPS
jgi:hypothetical protein